MNYSKPLSNYLQLIFHYIFFNWHLSPSYLYIQYDFTTYVLPTSMFLLLHHTFHSLFHNKLQPLWWLQVCDRAVTSQRELHVICCMLLETSDWLYFPTKRSSWRIKRTYLLAPCMCACFSAGAMPGTWCHGLATPGHHSIIKKPVVLCCSYSYLKTPSRQVLDLQTYILLD